MLGQAKRLGVGLLVTLLATVGTVVGTSRAAHAHGDNSRQAVVVGQVAGPYTISIWTEESADGSLTSDATFAGTATAPPELTLETPDGSQALGGIVDQDGGWTVRFTSQVGDSLLVSWASGNQVLFAAIPLEPPPTPLLLQMLLVAITVPGVWFTGWMVRRGRRLFTVPA